MTDTDNRKLCPKCQGKGSETKLWGGLWRSENRLDGVCEHLLYENCLPVLFRTKREAVSFIKEKYGYISTRPDLKAEPFCWRVPKAVRVKVTPTTEK